MSRSFVRIALVALAILLAPPLAVAAPGDINLHGVGLDVIGPTFTWLQVVDLDGDGMSDLLGSGGELDVWRNIGSGRLTPLPSFPSLIVGPTIRAIDLDGDGIPSLVSFGVDAIHAKEFIAPFVPGPEEVVAPSGFGAFFVQDADLDGDGLTDVVSDVFTGFVGLDPFTILTLLNDGSGGLNPGVLSEGIPGKYALGDIDLDGRIDVVAASGSTLTIGLAQGDGTFVPQPPIALTGIAKDVALGHIDGDGLLDVVVAGLGGTQVLVGAGGGAFTPFVYDAEPAGVFDLADADGDGDDDLLSAAGESVHISFVDAAGLSPQLGFTMGLETALHDAAFADFGGVGRPGVVVLGSESQFAEVIWVPGDGTGALDLESTLQAAPASQILALADVDGDGHQELVVWQRIAGQVVVQSLPGDGTLGPAGTPTPYAPQPTWVYVGASVLHLDADAFDDLLLQDGAGWHPWRSNGDGTFTIGPIVTVAGASGFNNFATGDIDGDGDDDLLVAGIALVWSRCQGDGTFGPPQSVSMPDILDYDGQAQPQLADADGDGLADLFMGTYRSSEDGLRWWKGAGDGTFGPPTSLTPGGISTRALVVADVDGDGHLDAIAHGLGVNQPPEHPFQAWLTVVHGHGDGTFDAPLEFRAGLVGTNHFVLSDLDLDGRLDALVQLEQPHWMLLRQAADGSFAEGHILPVDLDQANQRPHFVTVDLDADGDLDFVFNTRFNIDNGTQEIHASLVERNDDVLDLGHASVGAVGKPVLSGAGRLVPGQLAQLQLAAAPANAPTLLVLGLQTAYLWSAGSLLVPAPQVMVPVAASGADGTLDLTGRWPVDAPAGLAVYVQAASLDPATAAVVASNGVQLIGD